MIARMAGLASRQHGVVSRRQLIELGIPAATIADWVTAGHLHRLHRGVYAVGHLDLTREARWMAAVLGCGPGAALSPEPAGQALGIVDRNARFAIHVAIPPGRFANPRGLLVHRPRTLPL